MRLQTRAWPIDGFREKTDFMATWDSVDSGADGHGVLPSRPELGPVDTGYAATSNGDAEGMEAARRLENDYPKWVVVFGVYSRQFICIPSFSVPPGLNVVIANYPAAAEERMRKAQQRYSDRRGLPQWKS